MLLVPHLGRGVGKADGITKGRDDGSVVVTKVGEVFILLILLMNIRPACHDAGSLKYDFALVSSPGKG